MDVGIDIELNLDIRETDIERDEQGDRSEYCGKEMWRYWDRFRYDKKKVINIDICK